MSSPALKVAFLWHMHQPYYKNPRTGVYRLPWVRLHAVKDYYSMAARLETFPKIKANFNLVPCLVEQIMDYAAGDIKELHLELSRKSASDLTQKEKAWIVQHFFLGNRRTMIEPHSRYRSLLEKCIHLDSQYKVQTAVRKLKQQDFLDLQVWSNLAWVVPALKREPAIEALRSRERNFTEDMKIGLMEEQMRIMRDVPAKYKDLAGEGRIEISTSPYFHPILPLLCDSEIARVATPAVRLPANRFSFVEDAKAQIVSGLDLHDRVFGRRPSGMWPPEAAVSEEAIDLASSCGIRWIVTDEGILEASLGTEMRDPKTGKVRRPDLLYSPHRFRSGGGEAVIFFRDRVLSDLIGFEYRDMPTAEAVDDFMERLEAIRVDLGRDTGRSVVVVALDGENCWEFYDRGGEPFLSALYSSLSEHTGIQTVTFSEVVDLGSRSRTLKTIHPGSWIGGNLLTWIGHSEDNTAWDLVHAARTELTSRQNALDRAKRQSAWRSIYAAEGSDWFWWYGDEHMSREDPEFDALFRAHIRHVYESVGAHVPHRILEPVMADKRIVSIPLRPAAMIRPILDGRVTTFYEWKLAGLYESFRDSSKALATDRIIDAVYFGFDHSNLYLRLDTTVSPQAEEFTELVIRIEFEEPTHKMLTLHASEPRAPGALDLAVEGEASAAAVAAFALEITEILVPFAEIAAEPGQTVSLRIAVLRQGQLIERRPVHDLISLSVPKPDFDAEHWSTL